MVISGRGTWISGICTVSPQIIRSGPPALSVMALPGMDERVNAVEFFVHHEDVRRAQPGWQPRALHPDLEHALWRVCGMSARLSMRRSEVGVELVAPGLGRVTVKKGHPSVRIEGPPAELLLFTFGRREVAGVELDGPNDAIETLRNTPSGL